MNNRKPLVVTVVLLVVVVLVVVTVALATNPLSIAKDIAVTIAALVAAIVAAIGLTTWRQQFKGKAERDLARRMLHATYKTRDAIQSARQQAMGALRQAEDKKSPHETQKQVFNAHWKNIIQDLSNLSLETIEAEVLWGPEITKLSHHLKETAGNWLISARNFLEYEAPDSQAADASDFQEVTEAVLCWQSDNPEYDVFTARIEQDVKEIETFVKPFLNI